MNTQKFSQPQPTQSPSPENLSDLGLESAKQAQLSLNLQPVLAARRSMLDSIKGFVSAKFYDMLLQRLAGEEELARNLTAADSASQTQKLRYSHVLDSQYFEQRFIN